MILLDSVQPLYVHFLPMGVLTADQLDQVWNDQGMRYRIGRFHKYLQERGLLPALTKKLFTNHIYELLHMFFVKGVRELENGKQFADTKGSDSESETGSSASGSASTKDSKPSTSGSNGSNKTNSSTD